MTSPADDASEQGPERPPAAEKRAAWTRRFAPLLLLAGAILGGGTLFKHLPKERNIELRLDDAATVLELDLTWSDAHPGGAGPDATPLQGSSWRFAQGTAPRSLHTTVRLPDGAYNLEIAVDRTSGHETTQRVVTLDDASQITLPVREPR